MYSDTLKKMSVRYSPCFIHNTIPGADIENQGREISDRIGVWEDAPARPGLTSAMTMQDRIKVQHGVGF